MKKVFFGALAFAASLAITSQAYAQGTAVYDSIPSPTPGNVPSQGYQCCATAEIGDEIRLEPATPRRVGYITVLMSNWAKHSDYPNMPTAGYSHPITLNIYADAVAARMHSPLKTVTVNAEIPWRPEADPTCPGGTAWRAADGTCYNGYAFKQKLDVRAWNFDLPEQFIYGVSYDTNTWGYNPLGVPGPYESLNVGLNSAPPIAVGFDVSPDVVYWNTKVAGFYSDGGALGVGVFRPDTNWAPYTPAVQFSTFAVPTLASECKNGAWANLVRPNFAPFKNQGDCVSFVQTGK